MRDEKNIKGRKKRVAGFSGDQQRAAPANNPVLDDGVGTEFNQTNSEGYHFEQQPPAADLASLGTLPDDGPEEIPGFLRRCATETSVHDGTFAPGNPNKRLAANPEHPDRVMSADAGREAYENRARHNGGKIPTGARLRRETEQVADEPDYDSPDWSNTARSALSEMLTDIDNEQARRISNRDKFAALAGMRRSTWPLTALIVSFLLVVVAYSVRNIDASATPGLIWRQALALVVSPQETARVDPAPLVSEGQPPAALAQAEMAAPDAAPQVVEVQPVVEKKATGLVFEPVKIVGPLGPVKPTVAQAEPAGTGGVNVKSAAVAVPAATVTASVAAPEPARPPAANAPGPAANAPRTSKGSIALAPTKPVSPDKMPLASLAVSATEAAPSLQEAPRQLRRVASVSPRMIGSGTKSQVDVPPAPTPTVAPNINVTAVTPQLNPEKAPVFQPQPAPVTAVVLDSKATKAMLARAERLLEARDVASARLLFERAASYGSAEGAFGAAKTYDPIRFEKLGVYGVPAEPDKAAALYQVAIDAGHVRAVEYLNRLNVLRRKMKLQASTE